MGATTTWLSDSTPAHGEHGGTLLQRAALLYFFSVPLDIVPTPLGTPASIAAVVFLCVWFVALANESVKIPPSPILLALGTLLAWTLLTTFWSYSPSASLRRSITTAMLILAAIAISTVIRGSLLRPAGAMAIGSAVAAAAAIISEPDIRNGRATFLGIDQNVLAFHLALGLASALFIILFSHQRKRRVRALMTSLVLVTALILVGSRTGVGALIALMAAFLLLSSRTPKRAFSAVAALGTLLLATWLITRAGLVPPRILSWLENPVTMDDRQSIIDAFRITQDEWLIRGIGAGADADYLLIRQSYYKNAHSAFWKILIETGIIGLGLWSAILAALARRAYRSPERIFFALASLPIAMFFYTLGPISSNMLWAIFGLALGVETRNRNRPEYEVSEMRQSHRDHQKLSASRSTNCAASPPGFGLQGID